MKGLQSNQVKRTPQDSISELRASGKAGNRNQEQEREWEQEPEPEPGPETATEQEQQCEGEPIQEQGYHLL